MANNSEVVSINRLKETEVGIRLRNGKTVTMSQKMWRDMWNLHYVMQRFLGIAKHGSVIDGCGCIDAILNNNEIPTTD